MKELTPDGGMRANQGSSVVVIANLYCYWLLCGCASAIAIVIVFSPKHSKRRTLTPQHHDHPIPCGNNASTTQQKDVIITRKFHCWFHVWPTPSVPAATDSDVGSSQLHSSYSYMGRISGAITSRDISPGKITVPCICHQMDESNNGSNDYSGATKSRLTFWQRATAEGCTDFFVKNIVCVVCGDVAVGGVCFVCVLFIVTSEKYLICAGGAGCMIVTGLAEIVSTHDSKKKELFFRY